MKILIVTSFKSVKFKLLVKQLILEIFPSTSWLWQLGFHEGHGMMLLYITGSLDLHPLHHTFLTPLHLYELGLYFEAFFVYQAGRQLLTQKSSVWIKSY